MKEKVQRLCPHCETCVSLDDIKSLQVCPHCNREITPCSVCYANILCSQLKSDD